MTSPGLRERKKQKTRWAIQEHALRLFAQQGYDATTVEQIAAAAEVSPSTFFRYFKTKEDVVLQDEYDPLLIAMIEQQPAGLPPMEALRQALRTAFGAMGPNEKDKILARIRLQMSVPALRARTYEQLTASIQMIAEAMAKRVDRQADEFAVQVFAGACLGALLAALFAWAESPDTDLGDIVDQALAQLQGGVDATFASGT
ncbi:MAG TPA: TetR family transcriptional regulator [Micromonosporaceae bacterium]